MWRQMSFHDFEEQVSLMAAHNKRAHRAIDSSELDEDERQWLQNTHINYVITLEAYNQGFGASIGVDDLLTGDEFVRGNSISGLAKAVTQENVIGKYNLEALRIKPFVVTIMDQLEMDRALVDSLKQGSTRGMVEHYFGDIYEPLDRQSPQTREFTRSAKPLTRTEIKSFYELLNF